MKRWRCIICEHIHTGEEAPEECEVCGAGSKSFVLYEEDK